MKLKNVGSTGIHSTSRPKKPRQFTDNKMNESVENNDRLLLEELCDNKNLD